MKWLISECRMRANADAISDLITAESGLCKKDTLYEVGRACDVFLFAANQALVDDGQVFSCDLTPHGKQRKVYTLREPLLGAISAITPFNHPLNQVAHEAVADAFVASLVAKTHAIKYGDAMDGQNDMGTVIDEAAAIGFEAKVNDAIAHGAKLLLGNERRGALYAPTVLDHVPFDCQ